MRHTLKTSLLAALLVLLALPATSHALASRAQACPGAYSEPNATNLTRAHAATMCLINYERIARKLPVLRPNSRLSTAAAGHSRDMASRNYPPRPAAPPAPRPERSQPCSSLARRWRTSSLCVRSTTTRAWPGRSPT